MSAIAAKFAELRARNERALITFVTAGDPPISELPAILKELESGGADIIEVGIPFSDPIADGPVIQASSQRALDRGIHLRDIFAAVKSAVVKIPILYMGYTNTAMRVGFAKFALEAKASGASGVILSDMTPEESGEWKSATKANDLDTIFLAAPTSTDERLRLVAESSSGFVYCVSRTGVTGSAEAAFDEVASTISRLRSMTSLPICVGFGISKSEHVAKVCEVADGAVVGSHLVNLLQTNRHGVLDNVRQLKAATLEGEAPAEPSSVR